MGEHNLATTQRLRLSDVFISILPVLLAALFRFPGLASSPGWDGDEGYNLSIAWHLYHGQARAFALSQSFVQHPILYYALSALPVGLSGGDLWAARAVAALAGSLTSGFIYLATTLSLSRRAAVLATLAFAGAHFIVLHNRLAYTYNLLLL
ncbi:MAG TPA: glycosyltransferase family 39 protein, partial [Chloroflexota bacterium]|nr:glycosyltransferase family 39 protein [Chloroflexota bacterium]